jgi:hypothetical protein
MGGRRSFDRQGDLDHRAVARRAGTERPDCPAMGLDDALADGEAKTGAGDLAITRLDAMKLMAVTTTMGVSRLSLRNDSFFPRTGTTIFSFLTQPLRNSIAL